MTEQEIRKGILSTIYHNQSAVSARTMILDQLIEVFDASIEKIRAEVSYLEDNEYLRVAKRQQGNRTFRVLSLTAKGIDFVEGKTSDPGSSVNFYGGNFGIVNLGNGPVSGTSIVQHAPKEAGREAVGGPTADAVKSKSEDPS